MQPIFNGNNNFGKAKPLNIQFGLTRSNYVPLTNYNFYPINSLSNNTNISNEIILTQNQGTFSQVPMHMQSLNVENSSVPISSTSNGSQQFSRKPCNCTKSNCLKLYCECFANGQMCDMCNCTNCMNNLNFEEDRTKAIKMTLDRNPAAFHPKIGRGEGERKHTKGCNCKRSGCLKNYCECYEAKISCTDSCRCQGCKNTEDSIERKSLKRITAISLTNPNVEIFTKQLVKPQTEQLPHSFMTWDVIEAIANYLITTTEELEESQLSQEQQENKLIELYGNCLTRVIKTSQSALFTTTENQLSKYKVDNHSDSTVHNIKPSKERKYLNSVLSETECNYDESEII